MHNNYYKNIKLLQKMRMLVKMIGRNKFKNGNIGWENNLWIIIKHIKQMLYILSKLGNQKMVDLLYGLD
jgi:hypothetical protein